VFRARAERLASTEMTRRIPHRLGSRRLRERRTLGGSERRAPNGTAASAAWKMNQVTNGERTRRPNQSVRLGMSRLVSFPEDRRRQARTMYRREEPISERSDVRQLHGFYGYQERAHNIQREASNCPDERRHRPRISDGGAGRGAWGVGEQIVHHRRDRSRLSSRQPRVTSS